MIFAVTGRGRCAQGCVEVLENFPITKVTPAELEQVWATKDDPKHQKTCLLYTSPSPRDQRGSRMPSSA